MKTLNRDDDMAGPSYGWDGGKLTVTYPTPRDVKKVVEIEQAWRIRQAELDAQNAAAFDRAEQIIRDANLRRARFGQAA